MQGRSFVGHIDGQARTKMRCSDPASPARAPLITVTERGSIFNKKVEMPLVFNIFIL